MQMNDEPEIFDMPEPTRRESFQMDQPQGTSTFWKAFSVLLMILACVYDISPFDLSPDAVPILGWLDDAGITLVAVLNLIQQFMADQQSITAKTLRYIKWGIFFIGTIALIAIGGIIAAIIALANS